MSNYNSNNACNVVMETIPWKLQQATTLFNTAIFNVFAAGGQVCERLHRYHRMFIFTLNMLFNWWLFSVCVQM